MRLRSLEIQGFKSFPDKTRLEFDDGITAVVGPNGSGKSNIADAVRWVLGEQSTKNLRGQKMEDVIFSGTQLRRAQGFALVTIVIDNSDRKLPIDEDEVNISRRLYRSGESEYRICGTMVRLKDIHQLLMDTGLGRDGYAIIGQGRIAEIVSAKSGERREIFEEAAGISKYRYRKEEAEKKLGLAEENLIRLRDIITELKDRVEPLKEQSEKAKRFLTLSEEKKTLEISLWIAALDTLKQQLSEQMDKMYLCKNNYERWENDGLKAEEELEILYKKMQEISVFVEQKRETIRQFEEEIYQNSSKAAVMQNDIHHNNQSIARLEKETEIVGLDEDQLASQMAAKEAEIIAANESLGYINSKIDATGQRLLEQKELTTKLEEEILSINSKRLVYEKSLSEKQLLVTSSQTLLAESKSRIDALSQNSNNHNTLLAELLAAKEECVLEIKEMGEKIISLENTIKGYQLKKTNRAQSLDSLLKDLDSYEKEISQKKQRAKILEDLEASMEGFAGSVKYILGEAKKGAISGVYGVVSSLINLPSQYILAIETALGGAMQHIVVEDENVAKRAILALKEQKAGRATLLPLTSVKGRAMEDRKLVGQRGFVGIASNLVKCDGKFSGVIDQLLGRVCVVEDIDAGSVIAKEAGYSFRIVTLDGQVINAGGSYTGGSSNKNVGTLGRRGEIEKLFSQVSLLQSKADVMLGEVKAEKEQLALVEAYISGATAEGQSAKEEKVRLSYSLEAIEKEVEQIQNSRQSAQSEIEALSKRLDQLSTQERSETKLIEELELSIEKFADQHKSALSRQNSIAEGAGALAEELSELKLTRLSAQKDLETSVAEFERVKEQEASSKEKGEKVRAEIESLNGKNKEILDESERLEKSGALSKQNVTLLGEEIAKLSEDRTKLEGETTALRLKEREISASKEVVSRELAKLEERKITLQADYDAIISKMWDEYELTRSRAMEIAIAIENKDKASRRLTEIKASIKSLGTVNTAAIEEYILVGERYEFLTKQAADAESAKAQLSGMISELTQQMREMFASNFNKIAAEFSKVFVQLFGGGKAELTLTDHQDVLEAGVDIHVEPPGKIIKNLSLLSGGEQAFVAIAIYFAILKVKPAPFCLLDEIEAALDDVNVVKYANYLRRMSNNTQFIAITHRRGTMEEADVLYGVTMQDEGVSKLLELKISEVKEKIGL